MLRLELAFYLGCLNLHELLAAKGEPTCFPQPLPPGQTALTAEGLYDVCLSLQLADRVVGNDLTADGTSLVMITGGEPLPTSYGQDSYQKIFGTLELASEEG